MALKLKADGVFLPSPVEITSTNEIIWSANTGRSTASGKMIGDVIAEKQTFSIKWEFLSRNEYQIIVSNLRSGFHPFSLIFDDETVTIDSYRGTISADHLGYIGDGTYYYKSVSVQVIQQ